eukprot:Opistho-2@96532
MTKADSSSADASTAAPLRTVSKRRPPTTLEHFAGGTVGGMMGVIASYPLDTVKVRIQTQGNPPIYTGMVDCFRQMVRKEGVASLYRGLLSPVFGVAAIKATVFASYGFLQNEIRQMNSPHGDPNRPLTQMELIIAACGAGFCSTVVVTPVERIKVAMQAQRTAAPDAKPYTGSLNCAMELIKSQGLFRGIFRGFWATMLREVPSYGFYFYSYENVKANLAPEGNIDNLAQHHLALAGGIAGIMAWLPIYPIDVVKSRIQGQSGGRGSYSGMLDCAVKSYKAEGTGVFFRGLTPTIVRAFPCHAAVFIGYEAVMRLFRHLDNNKLFSVG